MSSSAKSAANEFEFSPPIVLFKTRMLGRVGSVHEFDVSAEGQRFLIGTLVGDSKAPPPDCHPELDCGVEEVVAGSQI